MRHDITKAELQKEHDALGEKHCALLGECDRLRYQLETIQKATVTPLRADTYNEAVRAYGKNAQIVIAMEEMADVEIMLEQLKVIFGNRAAVDNYRSAKLNRLADRLIESRTRKELHPIP